MTMQDGLSEAEQKFERFVIRMSVPRNSERTYNVGPTGSLNMVISFIQTKDSERGQLPSGCRESHHRSTIAVM